MNKGKRATRGQDEQGKEGKKRNRVSRVVGYTSKLLLSFFFLPLLRKKRRKKRVFNISILFYGLVA